MKALENEITTHNLLFLIILFLGKKWKCTFKFYIIFKNTYTLRASEYILNTFLKRIFKNHILIFYSHTTTPFYIFFFVMLIT